MDTLKVSCTLTIESVELYVSRSSSVKLATKGTLNVLMINEYNSLILQVNDFRYSLNENIPILVSTKEKNAIRSYVLPNMNGFYIIKVTTTSNLKVLDDLELILRENCNLAYKSRDDGRDLDISTQGTDLDDIQVNIDEVGSPNVPSIRPQSLSVGASTETKSPKKKKSFLSLFSRKSKKANTGQDGGKYMEESQKKKKKNDPFDRQMTEEVISMMDKEYVQGLIMAGKTIGDKYSELNNNEHFNREHEIMFNTNCRTSMRRWSVEAYENMNQALSGVSSAMTRSGFSN